MGGYCATQTNAFMVMVDTSKSMSQAFSVNYATRLAFAKFAAAQFIGEVNSTKDFVGLMSFDAVDDNVLSIPIANKATVQGMVSGIAQTQQSTTFYDALNTAITTLAAVAADKKVIVLISDGEDEQTSYTSNNPISLLDTFKNSGGIVICLGCRASGSGFARMEVFSTGGFMINGYPSVEADALTYFNALRGYICGGNCAPPVSSSRVF